MARVSYNKGKGEQAKWLFAHVNYDGDECLIWPWPRMPNGYAQVGYNGEQPYAHRFMCELVNGPPPTSKHQCAHSCGRGKDGCVHPKHLSWKTLGENMIDKRRHGTKNTYEWGKNGKLTWEQVAEIRATPEEVNVVPALAVKYNVTESNIRHIRAGRTWKPGARRSYPFTVEQIISIRATKDMRPTAEVAADYGVSPSVIRHIQMRRSYPNVG